MTSAPPQEMAVSEALPNKFYHLSEGIWVYMRKIFRIFSSVLSLSIFAASSAFAQGSPVSINVNGTTVAFAQAPVIRDGTTIADLKVLASAMGFRYAWYESLCSATVSNSYLSLCFTEGNDYMTISDLTGTSSFEYEPRKLSVVPSRSGASLLVSVRDIASAFGYALSFDTQTATVYIGNDAMNYSVSPADDYSVAAAGKSVAEPGYVSTNEPQKTAGGHTYYFQNQKEFSLDGYGSGYCWVCSYAMLISDVTGSRVTPADVARVNLTRTSNGAYCYHFDIARSFGVHFVSALSESSGYYGGRDMISGGTLINNPDKSDAVAAAAIREALALHPEGVMVRYADFPHTMVAVGYSGDTILFNDPAPTSSSAYSETGRYNGVAFEKTCVAKKGFRLADLTFIQAIDK